MAKDVIKIFAIIIACAFAYQAFDAFRSAFTGTQPKGSAPNEEAA
jgi:hypothetical protein